MLQDIRNSTKSGWTYLLVGMLIVVFAVFFGVPGDACGGSGASRALVATVGSTDVYTDDVNIIFNRVYGSQRRVDDAQLRQQQAQSLRSVLLINLLSQKAKEQGLRVADDELVSYLKDPLRNAEYRGVYGRDGGFDGPLYKAYVQNQLRLSIPRYEDWKKTELLAMKYLNLVEMQVQATPWEVAELHELRNTTVDLEFLKLAPDQLAEFVPVTEEDVTEFVSTNQDEIAEYYEENRSDYETPAEVLIRRIFVVKPEQSEGEEAVKAAIEKWAQATSRVNENPDAFADVAGELSESERETQGLMEWTTLENLDQNIASKVRDLKVGETAEIETEYAFMLVKVEERREATKTPLAEVQNDIGRTLLQEQKVEDLIREMISELQTVVEGKDSLEAALTELKGGETAADKTEDADDEEEAPGDGSPWAGVQVDTTGAFSLEGQDLAAMFGGQIPGMQTRTPWDRVPKIGKNPELARDAFQELSPEKPYMKDPYKVDGRYFFVRLKERVDASEEELTENESKLLAEVRGTKVQQLLGPYAALFSFPLDDYGPFLEGMLDKAIDSGEITLYERNYDAIPLVKKEEPAEEDDLQIDLTQPPGESS